jgi:CheY-like chemotaxis protein
VICNNGKEAIEELERQPFNLVLMDLQMPVMDGVTAMKRIRNSPSEYAKVPVIALTADTFAETVAEIAACSFRDFITKPFKADELIRKIALHVGAGAVA